MHLIWIVPALYWMRRESDFNSRNLWRYLGSLAAVVLVPYALVVAFVIAPSRDLTHILIWLKGSAGLNRDRHWAWHFPGWTGPWLWFKSTAPVLWGSFWPYGKTSVTTGLWIMTAIAAAVALILFYRAIKEIHEKWVVFALIWLGVYGLFLSTWEPETLCYRMVDVIPLGILMAVALRSLKIAAQASLVILVLATTLTVNVITRIGPMRHDEQNTLYQETLTLSRITSPNSLYITEGGMSWMYLLYFTGRTAWYRNSWDPMRLEDEIARQKKVRPVYIEKGSNWEPAR
jgi:hypothetical protein